MILPRDAILAIIFAVSITPAVAQTAAPRPHGRTAAPPKLIGRFDAWQAATHEEAGQTVCYALTRATASAPVLPGRGDVVLTVTHRPGIRDNVAVSAGYAFPASSEMQMAVEGTTLPFYTANRTAFARDGRAATAAFGRARQAVAKAPGPRGSVMSDTFPMRGFGQAYAAINRACPK